MNTELIKLSDGTTAITDENGKISKVEMDTSYEELLIKNKLEVINKSINNAKENLKACNGLAFVSKHMLILQPILLFALLITWHPFAELIGLIEYLSICPLIIGLVTLVWVSAYHEVKKKIKGFEKKIEIAEQLKLDFQKELSKEQSLASQREKLPLNKPISLTQQTKLDIASINEQLEMAYSDAIYLNPKKTEPLTLKRNLTKND